LRESGRPAHRIGWTAADRACASADMDADRTINAESAD
jgi:hypothetical protein